MYLDKSFRDPVNPKDQPSQHLNRRTLMCFHCPSWNEWSRQIQAPNWQIQAPDPRKSWKKIMSCFAFQLGNRKCRSCTSHPLRYNQACASLKDIWHALPAVSKKGNCRLLGTTRIMRKTLPEGHFIFIFLRFESSRSGHLHRTRYSPCGHSQR